MRITSIKYPGDDLYALPGYSSVLQVFLNVSYYSERIKEIELRITEATQIYKLTIRYRPGLKSLINF